MKVEYVIDTPLFDIGASHSTHVLADEHRFIYGFEMLSAIYIHHCDLRVEPHREYLVFCDEYTADNAFCHIHYQLQIET